LGFLKENKSQFAKELTDGYLVNKISKIDIKYMRKMSLLLGLL